MIVKNSAFKIFDKMKICYEEDFVKQNNLNRLKHVKLNVDIGM